MSNQHHQFSRKDVAEIAIGACMLALPLAVTEEVWNLGAELHVINIAAIALVSYSLIAAFVYYRLYHGSLEGRLGEFVRRVLSVYGVTLTVAALCLLALDKLPLLSDTDVALKRTVLVSLPGCFFATVVDSLR